MQTTKPEHALAAAQAYATRSGQTIHVWKVYNGMHQYMYCEWWPEESPETRTFDTAPDYIINPK